MTTVEKNIPKVRKVDIDDLKRDFQFYPRESVDYSTVSRFVDAMRAGCKFPPMKVDSRTGRIIDGFHRYAAYQQLGIREVDVIGVDAHGDAEFFLLCVEANKAHGLGYSQADQYKIVKLAARLGLEREKISFAVALPIQKVNEMVRNVPTPKPDDPPQPIKFTNPTRPNSDGHWARETQKPKADSITSSGFIFHCNQVLRFMRSDLCVLADDSIRQKLRELEAALVSHFDPEKLKDLICEKIRDGAVNFIDLSIEVGLPQSQVKAIVEELQATGRISKTKEAKRTPTQRGATSTVLIAEDEPRNPTPRDNRISHPAIQAFKTATNLYPNKMLFDQVIEILGDFPDVTRLNNVFVAWLGRGFKPTNLTGILDWYVNGIPENGNGKHKTQRQSASQRNVQNIRDSLAYLTGVSGDSGKADPEVPPRLLPSGS